MAADKLPEFLSPTNSSRRRNVVGLKANGPSKCSPTLAQP
jgi:hypothetical protein